MTQPEDPDPSESDSFRRYARVLAALAQPGIDPDAVLAEHGLSEAEWDALEDACDARLNSEDGDDEKILEHLGQLAQGLSTSSLQGEPGIDFDTWLAVTRASRTGAQLESQLAMRAIPLRDFLAAQAYWIQRVAREPELLARYRAAG